MCLGFCLIRYGYPILNNTAKKVEGHNFVGLLRKDDQPRMKGNRYLAERQLKPLRKRFVNDSILFQQSAEKKTEYNEHYAEPILTSHLTSNKPNCISHHFTSERTIFKVVLIAVRDGMGNL